MNKCGHKCHGRKRTSARTDDMYKGNADKGNYNQIQRCYSKKKKENIRLNKSNLREVNEQLRECNK